MRPLNFQSFSQKIYDHASTPSNLSEGSDFNTFYRGDSINQFNFNPPFECEERSVLAWSPGRRS